MRFIDDVHPPVCHNSLTSGPRIITAAHGDRRTSVANSTGPLDSIKQPIYWTTGVLIVITDHNKSNTSRKTH